MKTPCRVGRRRRRSARQRKSQCRRSAVRYRWKGPECSSGRVYQSVGIDAFRDLAALIQQIDELLEVGDIDLVRQSDIGNIHPGGDFGGQLDVLGWQRSGLGWVGGHI